MSTLNLPVHPRLRHPLTGEPLRAIYIDRHGKARWPVLGAAPDDPPKDDPPKDDPQKNDPPRDDPPKDDPPQDPPDDKGYPKDTPVAEMTDSQRAAYWQDRAQSNERRFKGLSNAVSGRTAEQLKADQEELDNLRRGQRTEHENAVEDARKEERAKARSDYGTKLAAAEFRAALAHVDGERRDQIIDGINLASYLTSDGDVDTERVKSYAEAIAPADTAPASKRRTDYGGGHRTSTATSSVSAGADRYANRRGKRAAS